MEREALLLGHAEHGEDGCEYAPPARTTPCLGHAKRKQLRKRSREIFEEQVFISNVLLHNLTEILKISRQPSYEGQYTGIYGDEAAAAEAAAAANFV